VALVRAGAVAGVERDAEGGYSLLSLAAGEDFAIYRFKEDEALYVEEVAADGLVTHTLSFTLERMDAASAAAVEQLCAASPEGLVAIVATNNDTAVVVGWSERFGGRYPLRLERGVGSSGRQPVDISTEHVVLRSIDTAKARAYTGVVGE
jgi:hypothetical protein